MKKFDEEININIAVTGPDGSDIKLADIKEEFMIVYFYPKDNTPGCTKEACSFRDFNSEIEKLGVKVIGISKDGITSHNKFKDKFQLNFDLWSDEDLKLIKEFGAWGKKKFMGKEYEGIIRSTFLIDNNGKILHVWDKVKTGSHGEDVLGFLKEFLN